jgi:hypothetical protein
VLGSIAVLALAAAACGGETSSTATPTATDSSSTAGTGADPAPEPATEEADGTADDAPTISAVVVDEWSLTQISTGIKPVIALDPADEPAIAFLDERLSEGYVSFASRAAGWTVEELVEGYFYGPIGLDFDPVGTPHIVYHDHQAPVFDRHLGDLTHAVRSESGWEVTAAEHEGHDGWDSVIAIGDDGVVRAAGIDPAQFGSSEGVEYYELVDGTWEVTSVSGGEPIAYEFNVDLQVAPDGEPALTYFSTAGEDLIYTHRGADGTWTLQVVDDVGDVGRYSSLTFSPDGAAHIAYWDATNGQVKHATNTSGSWQATSIGALAGIEPGQEGARRIVAIDVESSGTPVVVFSDTTGIWYGRGEDDRWDVDRIVTAGSRTLGQLVSMRLDRSDVAHIAFFEVTGNNPLAGLIGYLTTS